MEFIKKKHCNIAKIAKKTIDNKKLIQYNLKCLDKLRKEEENAYI